MTGEVSLADRVDAGMTKLVEDLRSLVQIPSVSSDPSRSGAMTQSANLVAQMLEDLGFEVSVRRGRDSEGRVGQPAVLASRRAAVNPETKPTVLLYAHHDVQPAGDEAQWTFPPFDVTEANGRLYGRGTADDGAGIVAHLGALRAFDAELPVNVLVFIEGEEEVGSPTFTGFLEDNRERLEADVIVVADSGNWTAEIPAITSSLRGVVACDVTVRVLEHGVHSGMFGGPILDAVILSSRLISTLHDEVGNVVVAGLEGSGTAGVDWPEADYRDAASVLESYELAGSGTLADRVWHKPAVAVIGMDVRPLGEASNTIAPECTFRLSLRIAPGQEPAAGLAALTDHLMQNSPFGAEVEVTPVEMGPSYLADLDTPSAALLRQALEDAYGEEPVAIGVGASIPFIADFQKFFPSAEVFVTGVEDPHANAHASDESVPKQMLRNAVLAEATFLQLLGNQSR